MNRREALEKATLILGYAITGPSLIGLMQGCKADPTLPFTPAFLSMEQALLVSDLCEIIIPKTDTPGAREAGVPMFIDKLLKEVYDEQGQKRFQEGLKIIDNDATSTFGSSFVKCSDAEKAELFKKHHDAAIAEFGGKLLSPNWWNAGAGGTKPFVLELKELTIIGFFTSEPGATQVLKYNQVPGPYKGCVPYSEVGKAWAT